MTKPHDRNKKEQRTRTELKEKQEKRKETWEVPRDKGNIGQ